MPREEIKRQPEVDSMRLSERLIDPRSPERRPRRAAYALPTLFTAGNVFLGFLSIMKSYEGSLWAAIPGNADLANPHFIIAAQVIGIALVLDGLDGRIARMTNTESEFGKEMDSLADVITFCLAPAVLAFAWGIQFVDGSLGPLVRDHLVRAGYFVSFLFLLCGACRLARFNVQKNPVPKNPGKPDRKYFVGLPTPPSAGLLASIVYACDGTPLHWFPLSLAWLLVVGMEAFLMVSTWRYRSFKDLNLLKPRSPFSIVLLGSLIFSIWNYSQPVLLAMSVTYVLSGILVRLGGLIKRHLFPGTPNANSPKEATTIG
jgi:CDP-diacylglycerol---serine O-phosphatidyltransferase